MDHKMYYYECSAKTGHNIKELFEKMALEVHLSNRQTLDSSSSSSSSKVGSLLDSAMKRKTSNASRQH